MPLAMDTTPIVTRGLRSDADYEAMASILRATRDLDGYDTVRTADQLRTGLAAFLGFEPAEDVRIASVDGQVVGFAYAFIDGDHPDLGRICFHACTVLPRWRGIGIGRRLLAEAQEAVRRQSARRPGPGSDHLVFRAYVPEAHADARRLLEHDGYQVVRYGFAMVRPTLADPPPVILPEGVGVRPTTRADLPAIAHAMNEAFADHWGWPAYTVEETTAMFEHPLWGQLDVWQVAWAGDEPVGGVCGFINDEENRELGRQRGYTENIWTRRAWRGRGIATALIGANLRLLAERGMTEAVLGVDAQNPTGALALYEKVGFVRTRTDLLYQRSG
jgi:GNAT superfamily N-acetyltransferase